MSRCFSEIGMDSGIQSSNYCLVFRLVSAESKSLLSMSTSLKMLRKICEGRKKSLLSASSACSASRKGAHGNLLDCLML
jgi:hypothetical protein